jgi:hypothetical protein
MKPVNLFEQFDASGTENGTPFPLYPKTEADRPARFIVEHGIPIVQR